MQNSNAWKTAALLRIGVINMIRKYGHGNIGFYTITFPEVIDYQEASRRWNNFNRNIVLPRYSGGWIKVTELQEKRVCPHYHLLLHVPTIAEGCVSERFEGCNGGRGRSRRGWCCTTVGSTLALERRFWLKTASSYGLGRLDVSPLHSTPDSAAAYLSKYISKSIDSRHPALKGCRLVEYGGGSRPGTVRFSSTTGRAQVWREGLALLAQEHDVLYEELPAFAEYMFPDRKNPASRWAFHLRGMVKDAHYNFSCLQPF